jgi:hypothetical protein
MKRFPNIFGSEAEAAAQRAADARPVHIQFRPQAGETMSLRELQLRQRLQELISVLQNYEQSELLEAIEAEPRLVAHVQWICSQVYYRHLTIEDALCEARKAL